ncbi:MAG: hypothetical protein ABIS36_22605 [Chryseolinea sp.]
MLFRLLLVTGIIFYVIYKIGSFFFRAGAASQHLRNQERRNFDAAPNKQQPPKPKRNNDGSKDGEYIDYEEVK